MHLRAGGKSMRCCVSNIVTEGECVICSCSSHPSVTLQQERQESPWKACSNSFGGWLGFVLQDWAFKAQGKAEFPGCAQSGQGWFSEGSAELAC